MRPVHATCTTLRVTAHLNRRRLRVGVVLMRRARRRHHHRVRNGMLHCSKITISYRLPLGYQVIGHTLRTLVVIVGVRV